MSALENLAAANAKADSRANFSTFIAGRRAADLTPQEKRQRLDALTVERNVLLKAAVEDAKAAQETDNQTLRGARK